MSNSPLDVPGLLRRFGLKPDRRLGQNFLIDPVALSRVVEAAEIQANDIVLEVGSGLGNLTRILAEKARRVIAVELDARLIPALEYAIQPYSNVTLVQGDILALNPSQLVSEAVSEAVSGAVFESGSGPEGYLVVANIPYYITSALIRHLLEASIQPRRVVLTVQREVAERIVASAGDMSLLALSVQVYGEPRIMARIPAGAFYPVPKVDSAVVRVDLYASPRIAEPLLDSFFRLAKAGFSQKRKTLRNALAGGMRWSAPQAEALLNAAGISPQRRAETLSLEEWGRLAKISGEHQI